MREDDFIKNSFSAIRVILKQPPSYQSLPLLKEFF